MRTGLALVFLFIFAASFTISKAPPTDATDATKTEVYKKVAGLMNVERYHETPKAKDLRIAALIKYFTENPAAVNDPNAQEAVKKAILKGRWDEFKLLFEGPAPGLIDLKFGKEEDPVPNAMVRVLGLFVEDLKNAKGGAPGKYKQVFDKVVPHFTVAFKIFQSISDKRSDVFLVKDDLLVSLAGDLVKMDDNPATSNLKDNIEDYISSAKKKAGLPMKKSHHEAVKHHK